MTQRTWFIFQGDHHIGPFSEQEMMSKIMLMELTKEDLIWKEGERDWLPVHEWAEFMELFPAATEQESELSHDLRVGLDFKAPEELKPLNEQEASRVEPGLVFEENFEPHTSGQETELVEDSNPSMEFPPDLPPVPSDFSEELPKEVPLETPVEVPLENESNSHTPNLPPDLPPDLPPLPPAPEIELQTPEQVLREQEENIDDQYPHEGDEDQDDEFISDFDPEESPQNDNDDSQNPREEAASSFELSHLKFYLSSTLGLVALLVIGVYLWGVFHTPPKAYGLTKADKESIIHVTQRDFKGGDKWIYKIRPTRDLSSLWLGANYPGEGWAILRMKTITGRYMGEAPVELLTQAAYSEGLAYFNEIELVKGESIVSGEYEYTLEFIPGGILLRWNRLLQKVPLIGGFFTDTWEGKRKLLKGKILLSPLPLKSFETKLTNYLATLDKNLIQPLKERKQRFETFLGLLEQMNDLYKNTLNRISKGNTIYLFEDQYNNQIGPMLRDLIIDSHKRHLSLLNLNPGLSRGYQELSDFGKEIGELASFMVTETKKHKRLNKRVSTALSKSMNTKVEELMKKGLLHIDELTQKLKRFN